MSRAGRRARRNRLAPAGLWESPGAKVAPLPPPREIQIAQAMQAERDEWVWRVGICGWEAEQARRRHARSMVARDKRLTALWAARRGRAA
jgi:hypothetical protein